jgi:superfamily II DNA or RNA helicase
MTFFRRTAAQLDLTRIFATTDGLREAQIGATLAAVSHFTTSSTPALLVLPTGVGKTALMTILPLLINGVDRVLVVAPTRVVRTQIVKEFQTLKVLKAAGCLAGDAAAPNVHVARNRVRSEDAWSRLRKFDVVVGLPHSLSPANDNASPPRDMFDLVIVDEAHHMPAATWAQLLDSVEAKKVYLTATPFRRDAQRICAEPAYSYSLKRAIEAGIYVPINYRQVEIKSGGDRDLQLARAAQARLRTSLHREQCSKLLVRTDRVIEAERLKGLYASIGVALEVVTADTSEQELAEALVQLGSNALDGLAFVGVLGEGFDYPALKIAVYHEPHRSVPATLQFVGRIARGQGGSKRPVAELLAPSDDRPRLLRTLYSESAEWADLLPKLFEQTVAKQRMRPRIGMIGSGTLDHSQIKPFFKAQIFRLRDDVVLSSGALSEDLELEGSQVDGHWISADSHLLAVVTTHAQERRWYPEPIPFGNVGELTVLVRSQAESPRLLFVNSTEGQPVLNELLANVLSISVEGLRDALEPIGSEDIQKALSSLRPERFVGVGVRSAVARSAHAASYRTLAGQNAPLALGPLELRSCFFGHALGPSQPDEDSVSTVSTQVGASLGRSTVWTTRWDDLEAFRGWCDELAIAISSGAYELAAKLRVSFPVRTQRFEGKPLGALMDSWFYNDREAHEMTLRSDETSTPLTAASVDVVRHGQTLRRDWRSDRRSAQGERGSRARCALQSPEDQEAIGKHGQEPELSSCSGGSKSESLGLVSSGYVGGNRTTPARTRRIEDAARSGVCVFARLGIMEVEERSHRSCSGPARIERTCSQAKGWPQCERLARVSLGTSKGERRRDENLVQCIACSLARNSLRSDRGRRVYSAARLCQGALDVRFERQT